MFHWYSTLKPRQQLGACLAAVLLATSAGCSGSDDPDAPVDQVTFVTGLGVTGREAAPYVAATKGFFADEHIKVTIKPGQAGDFNLQVLRGGQAQFVAIDYSGAVVRAGTGKFDGIRCVAVLQQKTVIALMALASSGITSPRDLPGKTVAAATGSVPKTLFPAYARLAGLDAAQIRQVKIVEVAGNQLAGLLAAGKVDAIGQFVPGEPTIRAAAKGAEIKVLPYGDYMSDLYGNVVVTRTGTDADLQRRFVRAITRGMRYAVDHPDEAGQIVHKAAPGTKAEGAAAELRLLKPYVGSPRATPELVARSVALMEGIGLIPGPVAPEKIFDFSVAPSTTPATSGAGGR